MEDTLAVYHRPSSAAYPLVCIDETSKQQVKETHQPLPAAPRRPTRYDYEYERNGVSNLFMMFAPLEGWRHTCKSPTGPPVSTGHIACKRLSMCISPTRRTSCWCLIT